MWSHENAAGYLNILHCDDLGIYIDNTFGNTLVLATDDSTVDNAF